MKTVKLSEWEQRVILAGLNEYQICRAHCFMDYKSDLCHKYKEDGTPRCKLKQAIDSIEDKLLREKKQYVYKAQFVISRYFRL